MLNCFSKQYSSGKIMNKIQKTLSLIDELQKENEDILNYFEDNEVALIFDEDNTLHRKFRRLEAMRFRNDCKIEKQIGNLKNFERFFDIPLTDLMYIIKMNLEKEFPTSKNQINLSSSFVANKLNSSFAYNENGMAVPGLARNEYEFGYEFFDGYKKETFMLPKITVTCTPHKTAEEFYDQDPIVNILDMGLLTNNKGRFESNSWRELFLGVVWDNLTYTSESENNVKEILDEQKETK